MWDIMHKRQLHFSVTVDLNQLDMGILVGVPQIFSTNLQEVKWPKSNTCGVEKRPTGPFETDF